jgi:crotonobetainyl-CoA:carnitine CoA-transferase CaiB-like acyl-CoA transferase
MLGQAVTPLDGLRVLDLSRVLAGPYATMLLADLGADVIKVENPGGGDDTRSWGPPFVTGTSGAPESTYFLSVNRGKRSVTVNLKDPAGIELILELARTADVLVENFRPGVMERLGLGTALLLERNPRLVILSISGFGTAGPDAERVGYDQILQAEGGLMSMTGDAGSGPVKVGVPIADLATALFGTIGVLAALREREWSGAGQVVSTSLLASQIALHAFQGTRWLIAGEVPGPSGNHHPTVAPYGLFPTGSAPIVIAVGNDAIWRRFAPLVGMDPDDERFATNSARLAHQDCLNKAIAQALMVRPAEWWTSTLAGAGVPAGTVNTLDRVYDSEQVAAEDLVLDVEHPSLGTIRLPGRPLRFSRSALSAPLPPPILGQHDDDVREDLWGERRR